MKAAIIAALAISNIVTASAWLVSATTSSENLQAYEVMHESFCMEQEAAIGFQKIINKCYGYEMTKILTVTESCKKFEGKK